MPGEDWYKAKEEWCDPDRPFDPSWNVPPKRSVQTELAEYKKRLIYGKYWEEPNDDPTQQDHFASTSFDSTHMSKEAGW